MSHSQEDTQGSPKRVKVDATVEASTSAADDTSARAVVDKLSAKADAEVKIVEMMDCLRRVGQQCGNEDELKTALKTLALYVTNLIENPTDFSFRTINLRNVKFHDRVGRFSAAIDFLKLTGFQELKADTKEGEPVKESLVIEDVHVMLMAFAKITVDACMKEYGVGDESNKGKEKAAADTAGITYEDYDSEVDVDDEDDGHDDTCAKCFTEGELIMCEACPNSYHLGCCMPPLESVPEGDWYCGVCTMTRESTGEPQNTSASSDKNIPAFVKPDEGSASSSGSSNNVTSVCSRADTQTDVAVQEAPTDSQEAPLISQDAAPDSQKVTASSQDVSTESKVSVPVNTAPQSAANAEDAARRVT
ncbi:hypothetical protein SARC_05485 [Sphaeroforma arctica JP610]|uniref:PHD-type domain-containing protein n=1 Tax=Sphaeroforma arctica JP610 TaxID=667725 RepID=A0A0L0G1Z7_9EUKA|nr:hypothetical protein SARC_05485 [Sphaeroforma arctica JP610]KNC82218.1 hypothetical protein SARC_05485 [Sphaeroforma arctica JP610]|eukprot:XP_014156120.1 hypothetical protein SARC_05485 [Sphaeroforma arctica JP610]